MWESSRSNERHDTRMLEQMVAVEEAEIKGDSKLHVQIGIKHLQELDAPAHSVPKQGNKVGQR